MAFAIRSCGVWPTRGEEVRAPPSGASQLLGDDLGKLAGMDTALQVGGGGGDQGNLVVGN